MSKTCVAAELLLNTQIDNVLRRSRAVQRRPADRSPEAQRISRLLCEQLDALVGTERGSQS
jgi:hypothetical protein